jgi:gluconokinase
MIVVIMGVSGSGKTTVGRLLARRLDWIYYEGDEFHPAGNIEKMSKGISLNDDDRTPWLASIKEVIDTCIKRGSDAVIACSALRKKYRWALTANASDIHFVYLKGDPATIRERMKSRDRHYMKASMLQSQLSSLEEPDDAIVIDIGNSPQDIVSYIESELTVVGKSRG